METRIFDIEPKSILILPKDINRLLIMLEVDTKKNLILNTKWLVNLSKAHGEYVDHILYVENGIMEKLFHPFDIPVYDRMMEKVEKNGRLNNDFREVYPNANFCEADELFCRIILKNNSLTT